MTTTTLTDRYVWAAARSVPEAQRTEFARELRERIGDAIDAHVARGAAAADAEHAALVELGDPLQLVAGYVDRPLYLIGPRYFAAWWRLVKLLLAILVPISAVGVLLGQVLSGAPIGEVVAEPITVALSVAVHVAFWTTLVFAIAERSPSTMRIAAWSPDQLPQIRDDARAGRLGDLIASVVALVILAGAIVWQQGGAIFRDGERLPIPMLDPELWSFWIPYFLVVLALEVAFAVFIYLRGWTWTMAGVNLLLNAAFTVPAIWLLLSGRLLSPEFLDAISWPWPSGESVVVILTFVFIGVAAWDVIDGFRKAWTNRRDTALDAPR